MCTSKAYLKERHYKSNDYFKKIKQKIAEKKSAKMCCKGYQTGLLYKYLLSHYFYCFFDHNKHTFHAFYNNVYIEVPSAQIVSVG